MGKIGTKHVGDLTSKGIHDCYNVGVAIRKRYISGDEHVTMIKDIRPSYNPFDYHFRSSDYERTLISQYVSLLFLFFQNLSKN